MQFAKRERKIPEEVQRLALVLGFGAILGLAGPFGSYPAYERPVRYAFWIGLTLAGYSFGVGATWLSELFPSIARAGRWALNGLIALVSAVPMTFVVAWTLALVTPGRVVQPADLPVLFACVTAVQILIVVALIRPVVTPLQPIQPLHRVAATLGEPYADVPPQTTNLAQPQQPELPENSAPVSLPESAADVSELRVPSDAVSAFPTTILSRLPRELGPDIVALEAEDHYVRVHTLKGSTLLLMRLSDAVELSDETLGMRVHRSWWVAKRAVEKFERDGQRVTLRLTNGAQIPVGRMYVAAVRSALRDS